MQQTPTCKPCATCGGAVPYEPIFIEGVDFAASFPLLCDPCELAAAKQEKQAERNERIAKAKAILADVIPPRMRETDISHPEFRAAKWKVVSEAFEASPHTNILLVGPAGLCKSRMLALLCKRVAIRGHRIAWVTAHDFALLADRYKNFKTRFDAQQELSALKFAPYLVMDDLGKQAWTNSIEEIFFALVDHRYSHNLPTWFSANTHPQNMLMEGQFSRDRGAAIVGRILEGATEITLSHD